MSNRHRLATLAGLTLSLAVSGTAMAANSVSRNGRQDVPPSAAQALMPPGPASITQSTSQTITVGGSISCNGGAPGFFHTDNSYFRAFTLSSFNPPLDATQFRVDTVSFGIEQANAAGTGTTQPVVLRLFDSSANPPTNASIGTAISTDNLAIPDQAEVVFTATVAAPPVLVNASDILVVEVFTPSGQAAGHSFFIGANALGQTGPGFIRAAAVGCDLTEITNLSLIDPSIHIVMTVSGNNQMPVELQSFEIR
ncbi:MAG: hypothetical protein ABW221_12290 [Vicinamibacteria bacterium]